METFLRWYLPLFLLGYLLVTFVLPSWRVYRRTGINPVTFGSSDTAHDYIGKMMKVATALLVAVVLLYSVSPAVYRYVVPVEYLEGAGARVAGLLLLHASLIWIMVAQVQMRNSWRIGIDEKNRTELVTCGVFRYSRNPVFLGMLVSVLGVFLVLPSAGNLVVLAGTYLLIQIQIRLEEEYLTRQHGVDYKNYQKRVRRLV
ncbi:isoprenylcysteine carboxylmethyltransferase family protein [Paraflavisolibacter sp. H34]|uniref:methyltransferase family protein n=1 Tax=Huijunlia imazamoxiresistens TaxID=3127457 RepID=UPI00301AF9B1